MKKHISTDSVKTIFLTLTAFALFGCGHMLAPGGGGTLPQIGQAFKHLTSSGGSHIYKASGNRNAMAFYRHTGTVSPSTEF